VPELDPEELEPEPPELPFEPELDPLPELEVEPELPELEPEPEPELDPTPPSWCTVEGEVVGVTPFDGSLEHAAASVTRRREDPAIRKHVSSLAMRATFTRGLVWGHGRSGQTFVRSDHSTSRLRNAADSGGSGLPGRGLTVVSVWIEPGC
jgi:hypothetical protein